MEAEKATATLDSSSSDFREALLADEEMDKSFMLQRRSTSGSQIPDHQRSYLFVTLVTLSVILNIGLLFHTIVTSNGYNCGLSNYGVSSWNF